jgi:flagellar basal body-associated protein FliL
MSTIAPTRVPTKIPTKVPTRAPTVVPTRVPSRAPIPFPTPVPTTQIPTIPLLSWAIFSSQPTVFSLSKPPTRVPTISMFTFVTNPPSPTFNPSFRPSTIHPTTRETPRPTLNLSLQPTSIEPSVHPTLLPTIIPTIIPTREPTISTLNTAPPSSNYVASLSTSTEVRSNQQSLSIIIPVALVFTLLIILAGVFIYMRKNGKKPPHIKWAEHYPSTRAPAASDNVDIHHFYNKSATTTPFTPHISKNDSKRYSKPRLSIHQNYSKDNRMIQDPFSL